MSTLSLTPRIGWLAITSSAILTYIIFNRLEPRKISAWALLLVGTPVTLTIILHPLYSSILMAIVDVYSTFIFILFSSVTLYRLSPFHPLAKFPGPVLNKITGFRMVMVARTGRRHLYLKRLHEKYGPFVRIGPNFLSIVDVDAIPSVLGSKGMPRGEPHQMFLLDKNDTNIFTETDPVKHAEFRKVWHRAFTPTALKGYDDIILKRLGQLVDKLGQLGGVVDFGSWVSYYKIDLMGDLAFGGGFEMLKAGGDHDGLWDILLGGVKTHSIFNHIPWIGKLLLMLPLGDGAMRLRRFSEERVNIRLRNGSTTHDFFHYLSEEDRLVGKPPSLKRLSLDGEIALVAASDTTSTTITGVFYHLLRYPEMFQRLRKEIENTFHKDEEIADPAKLTDLPYLNACINETLRLMPPLPIMVQRWCKVETITAGRWSSYYYRFHPSQQCRVIPPDTGVCIPIYVLFRDKRYFSPSPDIFWPDRWLDSPLDDLKTDKLDIPVPITHNLSAFIPFSFGPANCIGKQLAYREMRLVIATLVRKYDIRFADGYEPERFIDELKDETVFIKGELPVILTKRQ